MNLIEITVEALAKAGPWALFAAGLLYFFVYPLFKKYIEAIDKLTASAEKQSETLSTVAVAFNKVVVKMEESHSDLKDLIITTEIRLTDEIKKNGQMVIDSVKK